MTETVLDALRRKYPGAQTFSCGDNPVLNAELLALIRAGQKTASCFDLRDIARGNEVMPVVGRRDIALDWDGTPALVIETMSVTVCRFNEVDEDFAMAEGEFDDFEGWRDGHKLYFERTGGWSDDMELVCERYRLVEDLR